MDVNRAIKNLLFLEDCLIIPGLGGFVSQYTPARIDRAGGLFMPPAKVIAFHPELVHNDGILVKYLSEKNAIPIEMARRQVEDFVTETRINLREGRSIPIEGAGRFCTESSGTICFEADPGINLLPESYGLAPLRLLMKEAPVAGEPLRSVIPLKEEHATVAGMEAVKMNRSLAGRNLRRIAIAMPLLIVFSLLPYHSRITNLTSNTASLTPEPALLRLSYPEAAQKDSARIIEMPVGNEPQKDLAAPAKPVQPAGTPSSTAGRYALVAGCFQVRENAEKVLKILTDKGYPSYIRATRNGLNKVIVRAFETREEALSGLAAIRSAEPSMEIWADL